MTTPRTKAGQATRDAYYNTTRPRYDWDAIALAAVRAENSFLRAGIERILDSDKIKTAHEYHCALQELIGE